VEIERLFSVGFRYAVYAIHYTAHQIAHAFKVVLNYTAEVVGEMLFAMRFAAEQIYNAAMAVFNLVATGMLTVFNGFMEGMGYVARGFMDGLNAIGNGFKRVGKWFKGLFGRSGAGLNAGGFSLIVLSTAGYAVVGASARDLLHPQSGKRRFSPVM